MLVTRSFNVNNNTSKISFGASRTAGAFMASTNTLVSSSGLARARSTASQYCRRLCSVIVFSTNFFVYLTDCVFAISSIVTFCRVLTASDRFLTSVKRSRVGLRWSVLSASILSIVEITFSSVFPLSKDSIWSWALASTTNTRIWNGFLIRSQETCNVASDGRGRLSCFHSPPRPGSNSLSSSFFWLA